MNIRFVSSLTPEEENLIAPALVRAVAGILELVPIPYLIRIDTTDAKVYEHRQTTPMPVSSPLTDRATSPGDRILRFEPPGPAKREA
jgi:hypothetical protein